MNTRLTTGQLIGLAAAVLVLFCFFFPWVELNLLLASVNLSGFQLATGSGPAGAKFAGIPSLLLVPLTMVSVLVLVAVCYFGAGSTTKTIAGLLLIAGGVSALIILYQYFNLNQQLNKDPFGMIAQNLFSYSFGAHASLFGSVLVAGRWVDRSCAIAKGKESRDLIGQQLLGILGKLFGMIDDLRSL